MRHSDTDNQKRGYYFLIFKQDNLRKDLWLEDQVVFATSALRAAQLYAEVFFQPHDYIHSLKQIDTEEFEAFIRGSDDFECKIKLKFKPEFDLEIPAYLRYQ